MYRQLFPLLAALLLPAAIHAQDRPSGLASFIPPGFTALSQYKGDLNLDPYPDLILVLHPEGEDSLSSPETPMKRRFLLLLGGPDSTYRLAVQNDNVIYHFNYDQNFRESLVDISVEKGRISIVHYGGFARRWGRTTTFTYNAAQKDWFLTKDEWGSFNSMTGADGKETVYTPKYFGEVPIRTFNIYRTPGRRKTR